MADKRILLVEDEILIREMYQYALNQRGYTVETAEDGEQALEKLINQKLTYDLILLDVMMPKLDGISVLKKIKQPDSPAKAIPVFLLTNLGIESVIKEALSVGAYKCLIKSNMLPLQILEEIDTFFTHHT